MPEEKTRYRFTFYHEGRQYETTSSKSQVEAAQKGAIKLDKLRRGEIGISGNMTVRRWADEWLETYKKLSVTEKSFKDYKRQIDNSINPAIGNMRVVDVKDINLQKIMNTKSKLSHTRVKMLHNTIRGIFKQAKRSRLITNDPSEYLVLPKVQKGTHRSITDFEREHFLKAASTHPSGLMFKTMLYCGLRTGEVVALNWRDIDFKKHEIVIASAMESGTKTIKTPKTEAGIRRVPIPDELYLELFEKRGDPFNPVFTQVKGGVRHTESSRGAAWDSLKKAIDVSMGAVFEKRKATDGKMRMRKVLSRVASDFVPYCLRHTYCTDLQNKGVPINVAKYLMGHKNISVTASIYTHISDEAITNAAKLINNGISNGNENNNAEKSAQ